MPTTLCDRDAIGLPRPTLRSRVAHEQWANLRVTMTIDCGPAAGGPKLIGAIDCYFDGPRGCSVAPRAGNIDRVWVLNRYRRLGLATIMMQDLILAAKRHKLAVLTTWPDAKQPWLTHWLRRLGFRPHRWSARWTLRLHPTQRRKKLASRARRA